MKHFNAVVALKADFYCERNGAHPRAIRMHPEYLDALLGETSGWAALDSGQSKILNMEILLDQRWPRLFPCCLDRFGREEAIVEGARTV